MRKYAYVLIAFELVLMLAASVIVFDRLPLQMMTHWNLAGQADGFMLKHFGAFLLPVVSIALALLLFVLPRFDPLRKESRSSYYPWLVLALITFLLYIHYLSLAANLGLAVNFSLMVVPALAILFYALGHVLPKTKRNWFVGIRTPWTLSSDKVWDKTHVLAGRLFRIAALVMLAGLFFPQASFYLLIASILAAVLGSVLYSFWLYRKI